MKKYIKPVAEIAEVNVLFSIAETFGSGNNNGTLDNPSDSGGSGDLSPSDGWSKGSFWDDGE